MITLGWLQVTLRYVVDIDNTICKTNGSDYPNSQPMYGRIAKINDLYRKGNKIIYYTARGGNSGKDWSELTRQQLKDWGCMYDRLIMGKPACDVWIDDKAVNSEVYFK